MSQLLVFYAICLLILIGVALPLMPAVVYMTKQWWRELKQAWHS